MRKKTILILSILLILSLTACAETSTPTSTSASTATQRPSSTTPPTLTPTMTQTPSPTPIPPTPEGAEGLSYDPDNRSLIDPQGTPIFSLDENDLWVEVVAEWMGEMEKEIEEMGFADEEVVIEDNVLTVVGEQVAREGDGGVEIWVQGEWREARRASVDEEVWGRVYRVGGEYYKWYQEGGWREPEPVVVVDDSVATLGMESLVYGTEPGVGFMGPDWRRSIWKNVDRPGVLFSMNNSQRLKGLAATIERELTIEGEEREYLRFLVSHPVSAENEEPFVFQVRVPIEHMQFDFYWENDFKTDSVFTGRHEDFLSQVRAQIKAGFGFRRVSFGAVSDCNFIDGEDWDIYNLMRGEDAYIPRCEVVQEKHGEEMPKSNQGFLSGFMRLWRDTYNESGVKGLRAIQDYYFGEVEEGSEWWEDERVPLMEPEEWMMIYGVLEQTDRESEGY